MLDTLLKTMSSIIKAIHPELKITHLVLNPEAKKIYTIRRSSKCDLVIADPYVSRLHCTIATISRYSEVVLRDKNCRHVLFDGFLGKKNSSFGVWLEGKKQEVICLTDKCIIQISPKTKLQYIYEITEDKLITLY